MKVTVRLFQPEDASLIAHYWANQSAPDLLQMGALKSRVPSVAKLKEHIIYQGNIPLKQKQQFITIWEVDNRAIGHCFVNHITFGQEAQMHLHIWDATLRKKGIGVKLLHQSVVIFFNELHLHTLWCEPYAHNSAPNRALSKAGFIWVKNYWGVPGTWSFEQEVSQYKFTRNMLKTIDT